MTPVNPAPIRLADLAEEMRPDWDRATFEGILDNALRTWDWTAVFGEVSRLLVDPASSPRDLTNAVEAKDPNLKRRPADPEMTRRLAADTRELLAALRKGAA